jgi:hypothetical protein
VNARDFDIRISGSGNLIADSLICENIQTIITGSGNATLTGAAQKAKFQVTGSGSVEGKNFFAIESKCTITGSGNIFTKVHKKLDATITGSGNIQYNGSPETVNSKITGSGSVRQKTDSFQ